MTSRSATVLVIFIVAVLAFCLASVFASMTGPISILPNETESGGILDNLSAITDDTVDSGQSYGYQDYNDYSTSDDTSDVETTTDTSYTDDTSDVETTTDDSSSGSSSDSSSQDTPSGNTPSQDTPSSNSNSGGDSSSGSSDIETTTDD